ncbi:response regulator [Acanthopleuribacter pedis]|uniref:Response regulator n=1 Tax=Acanthopleuribacter pedis TaxID=442870 RepID=A0A8J7QA85_9BACT|nr:response regulator [Acanthopleuribacter pedis]MBO1319909.1 response regulator [Acanthopleuribacter pedis]
MTPGEFMEYIIKANRDGRLDDVKSIVREGLSRFRETAVTDLMNTLFEVDAKLRDTVYQLMIADGGEDLLEHLITIIRKEKNPLYFKNHILHFANLEVPRAIDALEGIEEGLPPDCRMQWQRSMGKLKAKFREYNYMREFEKHARNPKRVKQAADMMIKQPHPDYVPFLNRMAGHHEEILSREAVRVLLKLGNQSSFNPLSELFKRLAVDRMNAEQFLSLALFREKLETYDALNLLKEVEDLVDTGWRDSDRDDLREELRTKKFDTVVGYILVAFGFRAGSLYDQAKFVLLNLIDEDTQVTKVQRERLRGAVKNRIEHSGERLHEIVSAMSHINRQKESDSFIAVLEKMMPASLPERETLIFSALAGLESASAKARLLAYLQGDPTQAKKVLEALLHFELETVPDSVAELAGNAGDSGVRQTALALVAKSKEPQKVLRPLLEHESVAVRADVVKTIAEHQLESCFQDLLDLLKLEQSVSFMLVVLEALEAFERSETALAVQRFMMPPNQAKVRFQAMRTLFVAGGEQHRDAMIFQALQDYPKRNFPEMFDEFVALWKSELKENPARTEAMLSFQNFWEQALSHEHADVRRRTLQLMDQVAWEKVGEPEWSAIFQQALYKLKDKRAKDEPEQLRRFVTRINIRLEDLRKKEAMRARFGEIIERFQKDIQFEKVQALRELEQTYHPDMLLDNEAMILPLVVGLREFLDHHEETHKMEILAIQVAGKLGLPSMRAKIEQYLKHPNMAVAQAARNAMQIPLNEKLRVQLIKSVLVVDDSHYITDLVARILETKNYKVARENKPENAVGRMEQHTFDLLIIDLKMPVMDGAQVLQAAVQARVKPRFTMVLTGNRNREELLEASRFGVDMIVLKPFNAKDILKRIRSLEEKWLAGS